jgi:Uma2 family endonuclease
VRGADIAFVSGRRLPVLPRGFLAVAPELVVEIMSPDDRWQDVREKLADYFSIGVERVWIVDPQNRKVVVFSSPTDAEEYGQADTLRGEGILSDFAIEVAELFV